MISWIAAFLGEIFIISEELKFYKKKKEQRAYEKANKLPKKRMFSPLTQAFVIVPIIVFATSFLFYSFVKPVQQERDTKDTLRSLSYLLHQDKEHNGVYPENISELSRKNPIYGDMTIDSWQQGIMYQKTENGTSYTLVSIGKDGILNTADDITMSPVD
ncbi:hypothetical protein [uncultured Kordia sp.]|uniref:hypothetical protein n=1 Tax=uncultured Kordia sp. TaxID=507699 RepID=UPI0026390D0B|nr:hypothetical protein [uncultured Kordia sp.]